MQNFTLNLGLNWDSPLIGSVWGTESTVYRSLQYALADSAGNPRWFNFKKGDLLSVVLWNLTSTGTALASTSLEMSLGNLNEGNPPTLNPTSVMGLNPDVTAKSRTVGGQTLWYLQFPDAEWSSGTPQGPWGPCTGKSSLPGPLTFTAVTSFKLSFYLTAMNGGVSRGFLSDPEVIVGSGGD